MPYPLESDLYSPYGPVATFLVKGVQPPASQYIGPSDQIQITVLNPNVAVSLKLGLRLLNLKGEVSPMVYEIDSPATGATPFVKVITPGECFMLSATLGQANVRRGQAYCTLLLQRGNPTGGAAVGDVLIAGYPSRTETLGFPRSPVESSTRGRGAILTYKEPSPGTGLEISLVVPPATRWRVNAVSSTITMAGGYNDTFATLQILDAAGQTRVLVEAPQFMSNNDTFFCNWTNGGNPAGFSDNVGSLPRDLELSAGDVIRLSMGTVDTFTGGFPLMDPNATYGDMFVTVEEFAEI